MNRRTLISATLLTAFTAPILAACGLTGANATPLDMAKAYGSALADALSAGAQAYLAGPPVPSPANQDLVTRLVADLQVAKDALNGTTLGSDAKSIAQGVLNTAKQLTPLVIGALGPAGMYVPLAISVIESFVNALPPPPAADPTPPAELRLMAAKYKRRH